MAKPIQCLWTLKNNGEFPFQNQADPYGCSTTQDSRLTPSEHLVCRHLNTRTEKLTMSVTTVPTHRE